MRIYFLSIFMLIGLVVFGQSYGSTKPTKEGGGNTERPITPANGSKGAPGTKGDGGGNTNRPIVPAREASSKTGSLANREGSTGKESPSRQEAFCKPLWDHLVNWKGGAGEKPGATVTLEWYEDKSIGNDIKPGAEIPGPLPNRPITPDNIKGTTDIEIPIVDNPAKGSLFNEIDDVTLKANTGSCQFLGAGGRRVAVIDFAAPNSKGEVWGKCNIGGKRALVKFIYKRGKFENSGAFKSLE